MNGRAFFDSGGAMDYRRMFDRSSRRIRNDAAAVPRSLTQQGTLEGADMTTSTDVRIEEIPVMAHATPLRATDRCQGRGKIGNCGAQAYVRVFMAGGADLDFCVHHFVEAEPKLRLVAESVQDERPKLEAENRAFNDTKTAA